MRWLYNLLRLLTRCQSSHDVPEGDPGAVQDAEPVRRYMRREADKRAELNAVMAEFQARVLNEQRRQ